MNTNEHDAAWEWEEIEEVDSTNRLAIERVLARWRAGRPAEGLAIIARRQTDGRGQHGRRWESPEGGLYLSAVLENVPDVLRAPLALAAGVAVAEALAGLGAQGLAIRWPNDVVDAAGRKLAGILCEAVAQDVRWAVVVGIGVNVAPVALPVELASTSLASMGVQSAGRTVAEAIVKRLVRVVRESLEDIAARARRRDALRGQRVRLQDGAQLWEGVGAGIDAAGRLLLQLDGGTVRPFERGSLRR